MPTSNIYLIINSLLVHFAINSQIYNIQFAYKIEDLRKIVMRKYHYKKNSIVVGDYLYFLSPPTPQRYKNNADEKRSCNNFFFASIFYAV